MWTPPRMRAAGGRAVRMPMACSDPCRVERAWYPAGPRRIRHRIGAPDRPCGRAGIRRPHSRNPPRPVVAHDARSGRFWRIVFPDDADRHPRTVRSGRIGAGSHAPGTGFRRDTGARYAQSALDADRARHGTGPQARRTVRGSCAAGGTPPGGRPVSRSPTKTHTTSNKTPLVGTHGAP